MIPKTIHYCWFGRNPLTELGKRCIASWKRYCPDYEIIEWNEDNFDVNSYPYVKEAYEAKKWAFVSDVARLYAIVNYGGIYMDTDVEVIRPLDDLLKFHALSGFESATHIPTGLMACEKGHPAFAEFLKEYDDIHFLKADGTYDATTNVSRITSTCLKYGLRQNNTEQTLSNGLHLLPRDYLCPQGDSRGKIYTTENTYTIHYFEGSWLPKGVRYVSRISFLPYRLRLRMTEFLTVMGFHGFSYALRKTAIFFMKKLGLVKTDIHKN